MSKIIIVDSLMGSGKTTWSINYMKQNKNKNFLYITPYLDECKRIVEAAKPEHNFAEPSDDWPKCSKLSDIHDLFNSNSDIAASHELFKRFNDTTIDLLSISSKRYVLIIDEVMDLVSPVKNIGALDVKTLTESALIVDEETGMCSWSELFIEDSNYDYQRNAYRYSDVRELAMSNNLVKAQSFLLWRYNPRIFELFDEIYVMTYLFDGSVMKGYFDYHGLSYEKVMVRNGELVPFEKQETTQFAKMINIYNGKMNDGYLDNELSRSWYKNNESNSKELKRMRNNMDNYFRNILEAKSKTRLWTVYGDYKEEIGRSRYKNNFLSCNARATNEYAHTYNLAYLINFFISPGIGHYLSRRKIDIDRDQYALSMMVQWIWRSRIRNGENINIYIPSYRMRKLLYEWMGLEITDIEGFPSAKRKRKKDTHVIEDDYGE